MNSDVPAALESILGTGTFQTLVCEIQLGSGQQFDHVTTRRFKLAVISDTF